MEADACAELVKTCENVNKAQVNVLVGDDDSSTIAKVRGKVKHTVEKWSDITHAKNAFGGSLYGLQKKHKELSTKVNDYLQKCFSYAIEQNKDDPQGIRKNFRAIVPHAFGDPAVASPGASTLRNHWDTSTQHCHMAKTWRGRNLRRT